MLVKKLVRVLLDSSKALMSKGSSAIAIVKQWLRKVRKDEKLLQKNGSEI